MTGWRFLPLAEHPATGVLVSPQGEPSVAQFIRRERPAVTIRHRVRTAKPRETTPEPVHTEADRRRDAVAGSRRLREAIEWATV